MKSPRIVGAHQTDDFTGFPRQFPILAPVQVVMVSAVARLFEREEGSRQSLARLERSRAALQPGQRQPGADSARIAGQMALVRQDLHVLEAAGVKLESLR